MKRKPVLYLIYFLALIVGFVTIVLIKPVITTSSSPSNQDESHETASDSFSTQTTDVENDNMNLTPTYATELNLNMPNRITIMKNQKVKLKNGFYSTVPAEKANEVEIKFVPYYSSDITKISFVNNEIVASKVGFYKLEFSVKSSATKYITKSAVFEVVEENQDIAKNDVTLKESKTYNLSTLFNIKNETAAVSFITDDILTYNNTSKQFTATGFGETNVSVVFTENYVDYCYNYSFNISEKVLCEIVLVSSTLGNYNEETQTLNVNLATDSSFKITLGYYNNETNQLIAYYPQVEIIASEDDVVDITKTDEIKITLKYDYTLNGDCNKEIKLTFYASPNTYEAPAFVLTINFHNSI